MEDFKIDCKLHQNIILTICAEKNCINPHMCSWCFQDHDPSHLQFFRHVEDLSDKRLNDMSNKFMELNWITSKKLDHLLEDSLKTLSDNIQEFLQKLGEKLNLKYSNKIKAKFKEYETLVNLSTEEAELKIGNLDSSLFGRGQISLLLEKQSNI